MTMVPDAAATGRNLSDRLKQRDARALGELYDRHGAAIYSRMLHAGHGRRAAEDLTQETFLRAWIRVREFRPDLGSIEHWLSDIACEVEPQAVGDAPAATAPPKLRRRVLASAGYEAFGWTPFLAGAFLLALSAAVYFGGRERTFAIEVANLREQLGRLEVAQTRTQEALAIINDRTAIEAPFASGQIAGKVFLSAQYGVLLTASDLKPAPPGKIYALWLFAKSGRAAPAGSFLPAPDGTVLHIDREPVSLVSVHSISVTLEPKTGAAAPSSPAVFTIEIR